MIPTATVLAFFAWAYVLGLELGLCYGFLRPLRPRHTGAADLLFLLALYRKTAVSAGAVSGDMELRPDRRATVQAPFCRILENGRAAVAAWGTASEKNFPNRKKYVCIWGKMGYNRTEVYPSHQTHSRRYIL